MVDGARARRPGYIKGTLFQCGPLMQKRSDCLTAAQFEGNAQAIWELNKKVKLFQGEDGWFADGLRGQVWEYGEGKLGFTIGTTQTIKKVMAMGFVPTQLGDGEANFSCPWTNDTVGQLIKLLGLRRRKGYPSRPLDPKWLGRHFDAPEG